jgi:hypothetical protein
MDKVRWLCQDKSLRSSRDTFPHVAFETLSRALRKRDGVGRGKAN